MSLTYAIDRFEDHNWVVLEDDSTRTFQVPRSWVPAEVKEGDVLAVDTQGGATATAVRFLIDPKATTERQQQVERLRQNLPRGPKGDLSL